MNGFVQSLKKRLVALAVVLAVLAGAGGWWYLNVYSRNPEYTLLMVQEAVENHDKDKLYKYVAVDHLLEAASDAMLDGMVEALIPNTGGDTKDAVSNLTRMFKSPMVLSLRTAMDNYVANGTWNQVEGGNAVSEVDTDMIVSRLGLPDLEVEQPESVAVDEEKGTAMVKLPIRQTQLGAEFVLDVELAQNEDGIWQVYEITNLHEVVKEVQGLRRQQMKNYLEESAQLMAEHDARVQEIQKNISELLAKGSLGNNATRSQVKAVVEEQMLADWQQRKADLEAMTVPESADTIHKLRLKICDARIEAYTNYAQWMEDKKAATIKASDNGQRTARTLEKEAELLTKQVNAYMK